MDRIKKTFSANLDALIEKFREETNRQSEENFINTRRLTTESTYKPPDVEPPHDIDRQITDLESLIKRLQEEIIEMTNEADKPLDEESLREWFTKAHYNYELNEVSDKRSKKDSDEPGTTKGNKSGMDTNKTDGKPGPTNSHVFPVIISNINPLNTDQLNNDTDDYIGHRYTPSVLKLATNFTEIRKEFSLLWNDVVDDNTDNDKDIHVSNTCNVSNEIKNEDFNEISNEAADTLSRDSREYLSSEE